MERTSYQVVIEIEGGDKGEQVVEEILIKPKEGEEFPGEEEFVSLLENVRDNLEEKGIRGTLSMYRLERTLEASVAPAKPKVELVLP